jgi:hypothetical protein
VSRSKSEAMAFAVRAPRERNELADHSRASGQKPSCRSQRGRRVESKGDSRAERLTGVRDVPSGRIISRVEGPPCPPPSPRCWRAFPILHWSRGRVRRGGGTMNTPAAPEGAIWNRHRRVPPPSSASSQGPSWRSPRRPQRGPMAAERSRTNGNGRRLVAAFHPKLPLEVAAVSEWPTGVCRLHDYLSRNASCDLSMGRSAERIADDRRSQNTFGPG